MISPSEVVDPPVPRASSAEHPPCLPASSPRVPRILTQADLLNRNSPQERIATVCASSYDTFLAYKQHFFTPGARSEYDYIFTAFGHYCKVKCYTTKKEQDEVWPRYVQKRWRGLVDRGEDAPPSHHKSTHPHTKKRPRPPSPDNPPLVERRPDVTFQQSFMRGVMEGLRASGGKAFRMSGTFEGASLDIHLSYDS